MPRRMIVTVPRKSRCSAGVSACANGCVEDDVEGRGASPQQRLVPQQRERALERSPFGGERRQLVGLGEVLVDDLGDRAVLAAEVADDLPVHPGDGFLDAFEVAGKLPDERQQVGVAVEHLVVTSAARSRRRPRCGRVRGQSGDLRVEPVKARLPVGIGFGGQAADDIEDRVDTGLADQSPLAGEGLDQVERFERVRGEAVVLGAVVIAGADEPVVPEPLHAQGPSGPVGDGLSGEAKLVQVVVDLLVEALGGDGALVPGERRAEDREHQRCPFAVEQAQGGLVEGVMDADELGDDVAHRAPFLAHVSYDHKCCV